MKKFIFIISAILLLGFAVSCTSCSNDTPWGIEYDLQSDGMTDAFVSFQFVNGDFNLNGDASYQFCWSNAPTGELKTPFISVEGALPLIEALACEDKKTLEVAEYVNSWIDQYFKIIAFEGHYDIYIKGYVKETKTQITFNIDRHWTNKTEEDENIEYE